MKVALLLVLVACGGSSPGTGGDDDDGMSADGGTGSGSGQGSGSGSGQGSALHSTLTSSCATLQGRAVVNENGNLGVAFTESDSPYTFLGSVQFQLPDGFTGAVPDPENWDGSSERHVVAVTSAGFELHGNHCWPMGSSAGGSVTVTKFAPSQGIVKATFTNLVLRSCTSTATCTVNGSIETTGEGVFD